jgi:hypothetical protein
MSIDRPLRLQRTLARSIACFSSIDRLLRSIDRSLAPRELTDCVE